MYTINEIDPNMAAIGLIEVLVTHKALTPV